MERSPGRFLERVSPVILAGGQGTRLRPVLPGRQKILAPVGGRPFISCLLDRLAGSGFKRTLLCTGHLSGQVLDEIGHSHQTMAICYSTEHVPLGTGGAVRLGLERISTDYLMVMNGDSFIDVKYLDYIQWHFSRGCDASLVLSRVEDVSRYGAVRVDENARVVAFREKAGNAGAGWVNAGIYLLSRKTVMTIPGNRAYSLEKGLLPRLCRSGLSGFCCRAPLLDIGTPRSYARVRERGCGETDKTI